MKSTVTLLALASLFLLGCQQQPSPDAAPAPAPAPPALDIAAETAALMKVVEGETDVFMKKNLESSLEFYASAPDISHTVFGNGDTFYRSVGRAQMEANMKAFWDANPNFEVGTMTRSNWVWRISPDLAWCSFDGESTTGNKTHEERLFVRENGQWKIHTVTVGQTGGSVQVK